MNTRECSKRHENKTWKDANKFSVLYQCQYPSCNIVTVVLQNVTIGEAGKSAVDLSVLFLATVCESTIIAIT